MRVPADLRASIASLTGASSAERAFVLADVVAHRMPVTALALLPHARSMDVDVAIVRVLSSLAGDELAALDRAARSAATLRSIAIDAHALPAVEEAGMGALVLLSMGRDGRAREAATRALVAFDDDLATLALLVRVDDTVAAIGELAAHAVEARVVPERASSFVGALPLVEGARGARSTNAGARVRSAIRALLLADDAHARSALDRALQAPSASVRAAASRFVVGAGHVDATVRALEKALAVDEQPWRRAWAANEIARASTPPSIASTFAPRLAVDRSPAIRCAAARAAGRVGATSLLEALTVDAAASVRSVARTQLQRAGGDDERERARAILRSTTSSTRALLGALGALSEIGRPDDFAHVAPFLHDERARVVAEAVRALAGLHASGGLEAFVDVLHDKLTARSTRIAREAARALAQVARIAPDLVDVKLVRALLDREPPRALRRLLFAIDGLP